MRGEREREGEYPTVYLPIRGNFFYLYMSHLMIPQTRQVVSPDIYSLDQYVSRRPVQLELELEGGGGAVEDGSLSS